jgi:thiol-disulfide isomerase/thioredoxin
MKLQYLAILATISLLSLTTACSTPSATNPSNNVATENKTNSCAGKKADPCAGKNADPCAGKKADPCAGKNADPCAGKNADPCAGKKAATSVGDPLTKQLQGKPVVVDIYASWCPACKNIAPTVSQIKQQYAGKINFITLDVSSKDSSTKAEAIAKQLGLSKLFAANKTKTGTLLIIDPATENILTQQQNNPDLNAYSKVLDLAIAKK